MNDRVRVRDAQGVTYRCNVCRQPADELVFIAPLVPVSYSCRRHRLAAALLDEIRRADVLTDVPQDISHA